MNKTDIFDRIKTVGIIPALRTTDPDDAVNAAEAIRLGGIGVIEVSFACGNGVEVLGALAKAHSQTMIVGAGTIIDAEGVQAAADAGAEFIVTPGFNRQAVEKARELGLNIFAGAFTPTEVQDASASGADAVKLFPCFAAGGSHYLRALRGQYTATKFIASGGVGLENCADYIRAGACAIGVGGEIADFENMAGGEFKVFTVRARRLRQAVESARKLMESGDALTVGEGR